MTHPFRIGLINQYDQRWVAGTEYFKNIILGVSTLSHENRNVVEIYLITGRSTDKTILHLVEPHLKDIFFTEEIIGSQTFPKNIKRKIASIFFKRPYYLYENFLNKFAFDFVYPYFSPCDDDISKKSAAWIFDFQHKYLAKYFSKKEIFIRNRHFGNIAKYASEVIVSSKCAQRDFHEFFPQAASKSRVLPFRSVPSPEWFDGNPKDVQNKYSLPDKFFIVCNQFWQHKNHLAILESMNLLKMEAVRPMVVCTGHLQDYRRSGYYDEVLKTIRRYDLKEQIMILGLVPKIDQIQLLRRSIAVIQPSLFEGWSTVVEEARCFGKPIILSDISVHLEQNPPNCEYYDRNSPYSLAEVMAKWWKNLLPGPDIAQEAIGKENNKEEVRLFARKFLDIAKKID
jgi:glycosyltransferase involved in cell wall biosynthesis